MFGILNTPYYTIGGVKVDINPIKEDKFDPLDEYLNDFNKLPNLTHKP